MKRRDFMSLLAMTGLTAVSGWPRPALAATPDRFWVMVNASGGWDPTSLIDPKGDLVVGDNGPVNKYLTSKIRQAGNIRYAPYPEGLTDPGTYERFFTRFAPQLLVINGIDTETNSHDAGSRFIWSGGNGLSQPALAALVAATYAPERPMSFISNGGYDQTAGFIGATRVSGASTFAELAFPNRPTPSNLEKTYFAKNDTLSIDIAARIEQAKRMRLQRQISQESLPARKALMSQLFTVSQSSNNLDMLVTKLPEKVASGIQGQAEVAAAAFASGLAVCANLNVGGFDTHGNHDNSHYPPMVTLLEGIERLWDEVLRHGLQDKVTVVVGSDFGRTPYYNSGNGKDHWNITSMMFLGAGIKGNRVIGATDDKVNAKKLDPQTLAPSESGLILNPTHIHMALRKLAGIEQGAPAQAYPIQVPLLNLFG